MPIFGNEQSGRRGFGSQIKMRLIIALIFAAGAIIPYIMSYQKDPLTGEYAAFAMSPEQEITLGLQSAPQMAREMGGVIDPNRSTEAQHVHNVGTMLVKSYKASQSKYAGKFNFYLLADAQNVNAFALPGGQIFITKALYDRLENDAQLAGVLGHEIGHVLYRHASQHMAKSKLGQGLVGAVASGTGDQTATQIAHMVNQMTQLKYGREDESESDTWGLENMMAAGLDPVEMVRVMQILKEASGGRSGSSLFASHPNPDKRIEDIKAYLEDLKKKLPNGLPKLSSGNPIVRENRLR